LWVDANSTGVYRSLEKYIGLAILVLRPFENVATVNILPCTRRIFVLCLERCYILINDYEYNLVSTAVHVGAQDDGHYVSFVKRRNKWFFINDEMVREEKLPDEAGFYFMVYNLKN
jgi:hypothetical protein